METLLYFVICLPLVVLVLVAFALLKGGQKYLEEMGLRFWHWLLRTKAPLDSQTKESNGARPPDAQKAATAPAAATQSSAAGVTPQLPDPVADFTGRKDQAEQLIVRLRKREGAAITAIGGQGGVGKTELAYYVAREVRELYPGGQVLVNLRGLDAEPVTTEQAMAGVILAVEPEQKLPDKPEQIAGLYYGLLGERAVLVLADNAKDSEQVRPLVPKPPSALLVTSRQTVQVAGVERVSLEELPRPESVALLREILGDKPAEDGEVDRLAERCGDLPLALRVGGNRLAASPALSVAAYLERLEARRSGLQFEGRDVTAVLAESVEALERDTPEFVGRWRSLAVFPAPFDRAAAEAVGEFEDGELDTLVGRSLVLYDTKDERFRLHDLMRDLAREGWGEEGAYDAAKRHAEHYLTVASQADDTYTSGGEGVLEGLRRFDRERAHIEAGQAWAAEHASSDDRAATLAEEYPMRAPNVLELRQHPRERIRWLEASVEAARKLGHKDREGMALGNLGLAYAALGETRRAIEYFEQDLAIARETGDRRGEGMTLGNLGNAYADLGETRRAIESYEQQLTITRETGDRSTTYERGEGAVLGNLGVAYRRLGETRRAIGYYEQQLVITRETGDRRGEGNALWNMSLALDKLGERAKAVEHARDALAIFEQIEDPNAGKVRRTLEEWGAESEAGGQG